MASWGPGEQLRSPSSVPVASSSLVTTEIPNQQCARSIKALFGLSMSGSEFNYGTYPTVSDLNYVLSKGITLIRLPISWEKMQSRLSEPLNSVELEKLKAFLDAAAARRMRVIVDLHNYGRYDKNIQNAGYGRGETIGSAAVPIPAFADFWTKLASELKDHPAVWAYDIMNEPHNMGRRLRWPKAAQAAVNGIRSVDMRTTLLVEGDGWAQAFHWGTLNAKFLINDPANNLLYEAHEYFDKDTGGGKYANSYDQDGTYPNIGVDRIRPFLNWLQQNNVKGFLGEFGVPDNDPRWLEVLDRFLAELKANGISGTYWAYRNQVQWWPSPLFINPRGGQDAPQMKILLAHIQLITPPFLHDPGSSLDTDSIVTESRPPKCSL